MESVQASMHFPAETEGEVIKKRTLAEILSSMRQIESLIDDPDFDAASVVGDMKIDQEALQKKVDSLDYVISEFEAYAARTEIRAKRLATRARAARNRATALADHIKVEMEMNGWKELIGVERKIIHTVWHTPSMRTISPPTAEDAIKFEALELVKLVPHRFEWDTTKLKNALLNNIRLKAMIRDAKTHEEKKALEEELAPVDGLAVLEYSTNIKFDERDRPDVVETKKPKASRSKK